MTIVIIMAMDEELSSLKKDLPLSEEKEILGYKYSLVNYKNENIVLLESGIGKVNAAISTTYILNTFDNIKYVINAGTAGGVDCFIGDIVLAKSSAYHDVDVSEFGYKIGQIPKMPLLFESSISLVNKFYNELKNNFKINIHKGVIVSGDRFLKDKNKLSEIANDINNIKAVDMETAAVMHVCYRYNVPAISIRCISDIINCNSKNNFNDNLKKSSLILKNSILSLLKKL